MTPQEERHINAKFVALVLQRDLALKGQVEDAGTIATLNAALDEKDAEIAALKEKIAALESPQLVDTVQP